MAGYNNDMQPPKLFNLGVKGVITNSDREILLLKRQMKASLEGFIWDLPGGLIEEGENERETLKREVLEETGLTIEVGKFLHAFINDPKFTFNGSNRILFIYWCDLIKESNVTLSNEHTEFGWFSISDVYPRLQVRYPSAFTNNLSNLLA